MARPLAGISIPIILGGMAILLIGVIWALQRGERHTHAAALALVSSVIVGACGFSVPSPPVSFGLDMALGGFCCSIAAMLTMPLLSEWKEIMFAPAVAGISLGAVGNLIPGTSIEPCSRGERTEPRTPRGAGLFQDSAGAGYLCLQTTSTCESHHRMWKTT